MKNKQQIILSTFLFLILFLGVSFITPKSSYALDTPFSVSPLDPKTNQPQGNYYDLKVSPDTNQILKIRIYNSGDKEHKFHIALNNGSTNNNGITSYLENNISDPTLKVPFSSIASITSDVINIKKREIVDVPITLKIPNTSFKGEILGGIRITLDDNKEQDNKKNKVKASVTSNIAYTIGVVLRESDDLISPKINLLSVQTEQRNTRNFISATLQNSSARIIKKFTASANIYKKGGTKVYYSSYNNDMRMAPNSNFNYGISLQDQAFQAGEYTLNIKGEADGVPYNFTKDFTITRSETLKWNKSAVYVRTPTKDSSVLYLIIIGLVLFILISTFTFIYTILKKKQKI